MKTRAGVVSIAVIAAVLTALASAPAHAAAYRYWTYWQASDATWTFATAGPAFTLPSDGSVEGWRFAVTSESGQASDQPTALPDFSAICDGVHKASGEKRIALVVDAGEPADAPDGEAPFASISRCVTIADDATGYDILRSVAPVRTDDGLVCAISDYPADECAPVIDTPLVAATPQQALAVSAVESAQSPSPENVTDTQVAEASTSPTGPWATIAVVAVVAVVGLLLWRRRRHG